MLPMLGLFTEIYEKRRAESETKEEADAESPWTPRKKAPPDAYATIAPLLDKLYPRSIEYRHVTPDGEVVETVPLFGDLIEAARYDVDVGLSQDHRCPDFAAGTNARRRSVLELSKHGCRHAAARKRSISSLVTGASSRLGSRHASKRSLTPEAPKRSLTPEASQQSVWTSQRSLRADGSQRSLGTEGSGDSWASSAKPRPPSWPPRAARPAAIRSLSWSDSLGANSHSSGDGPRIPSPVKESLEESPEQRASDEAHPEGGPLSGAPPAPRPGSQ